MADETKLLPGDAEPDASVTKRSLRRDFFILLSRLPYGLDFFVALRSSAFFVANIKRPCSKLPFFLAAPDEEQRLCDTQATRLLFGTAGDKWLFGFMISLLSFFSLYSTIFSLVVGGVTKRCGAYDPKTFFLSKPSGWFIQSTRLILALFANFTPRSKVEEVVVFLIVFPFYLAVKKTVEYEREAKKFKDDKVLDTLIHDIFDDSPDTVSQERIVQEIKVDPRDYTMWRAKYWSVQVVAGVTTLGLTISFQAEVCQRLMPDMGFWLKLSTYLISLLMASGNFLYIGEFNRYVTDGKSHLVMRYLQSQLQKACDRQNVPSKSPSSFYQCLVSLSTYTYRIALFSVSINAVFRFFYQQLASSVDQSTLNGIRWFLIVSYGLITATYTYAGPLHFSQLRALNAQVDNLRANAQSNALLFGSHAGGGLSTYHAGNVVTHYTALGNNAI